jgi:hypothetical protein
LGGDKTYPFTSKPEGWHWYITKTGEDSKDIDKTNNEIGQIAKNSNLHNVQFDPAFARLRGVVERTIGKIKFWPIFSQRQHTNSYDQVKMLLTFAVGLINWMFDNHYYDLL